MKTLALCAILLCVGCNKTMDKRNNNLRPKGEVCVSATMPKVDNPEQTSLTVSYKLTF